MKHAAVFRENASLVWAAQRYLGSWSRALQAAGIRVNRPAGDQKPAGP